MKRVQFAFLCSIEEGPPTLWRLNLKRRWNSHLKWKNGKWYNIFFREGACSNDLFFLTSIKVKNVVIKNGWCCKNVLLISTNIQRWKRVAKPSIICQGLQISNKERNKIPFGIFYFFWVLNCKYVLICLIYINVMRFS